LFAVQKALMLMNVERRSFSSAPSRASKSSRRRLWTDTPKKPSRGSRPLFRWDALESRTKSRRQRCSWPQTIPALSRASTYSSMAAGVKFDQRKRCGRLRLGIHRSMLRLRAKGDLDHRGFRASRALGTRMGWRQLLPLFALSMPTQRREIRGQLKSKAPKQCCAASSAQVGMT
jgi:hypothetical protein